MSEQSYCNYKTILPESEEHPLATSKKDANPTPSLGWIRAIMRIKRWSLRSLQVKFIILGIGGRLVSSRCHIGWCFNWRRSAVPKDLVSRQVLECMWWDPSSTRVANILEVIRA